MATNFVTAKYQEIYDVNTVTNEVSIIGIHTPVGLKPRQMLAGHFLQFRKFKYQGCSVVGTPAQRLGLQMTDITVEAGASGVNPKDVFNPALVRGCHGDNLSAALNSIYKGSFENEGSSIGMDQHTKSVKPTGGLTWEQMYYRMLQDPSFKKFNLSSGIKLKALHPMVYNVASNHQILDVQNAAAAVAPSGGMIADPDDDGPVGFGPAIDGAVYPGDGSAATIVRPRFMTNRLQSLGWMDTRQVINAYSTEYGYTCVPKIFMACIILPPALSNNVVTSMRFVVTHYFAFKEFNTSLTLEGASEYYDWLTTSSKEVKQNDTLDTNGECDSVEAVSDGCF